MLHSPVCDKGKEIFIDEPSREIALWQKQVLFWSEEFLSNVTIFFYAKGDFGNEMLVVIAFAERHPKLVARKNRDFSRRTSK